MSNISDNIKEAFKDYVLFSFNQFGFGSKSGNATLANKARVLRKAISDEGLDFEATCLELKDYYEVSANLIIHNK